MYSDEDDANIARAMHIIIPIKKNYEILHMFTSNCITSNYTNQLNRQLILLFQ